MLTLLAAMALETLIPHPKGYVCLRTETPLKIDGNLEDPAWKNAPWTDEFIDIRGEKKSKPRFKTRAKMLWDDDYFYVGAEMEEPHVWATLIEHDSVIFHDNDFEVFIDPNGDNHDYYEFEINALNTGWDLRLPKPYRDGGPALNEWEIPGLKTAVHVKGTLNDPSDKDEGWTVEIAFPWKVLGVYAGCATPPKAGDQWRVNFSRVEWLTDVVNGQYRKTEGKPEDNWVWSPQHAIDMHRPEYWGYVQFSDKSKGPERFQKDETWDARMRAMSIYYAQREFESKHKRWAGSLEELGKTFPHCGMTKTKDGWEAWTEARTTRAHPYKVFVRQDSKLWTSLR